ncbi:hypothetical protein Acor_83850 [Acrocarpospora corrugata]|uniref:Uncharacterized protein n=1 Tax=Acrocarpospora corrugata TaxID=35763 RepID=A0A5M3WBV4_9ACTN|nr:hypothetical protein [Acrocarpospora corrugata]GES06316.1 hypothetical protein Acor_83850 [Acrocarpospora corrugata]
MHAHRDEIVFLLLSGCTNRRTKKRAAQLDAPTPDVPRLQDVHFPLGGPRFRLCLKDVLQFLIEELSIDKTDTWRTAVEEGRRTWRPMQLGAAVRDTPEEAVRVLTSMGYLISPPDQIFAESDELAMY